MKTYEKIIAKSFAVLIIFLLILTTNLNIYAYDNLNNVKSVTSTDVKVEKVSNPDAGEGEADGLVEGGDRETSYAWAMAQRGDYLYIGTNKNIVGSIADTFVKAMASAGVSEDIAWGLINSMTNNEIPRPTTETGGYIFKYDMNAKDFEIIYTADKGVAFRMAVEFEGNLYFASFSSDTTADNYIYKIDENDKVTVAFTSESGTSMRASCVYDGSLLFGGVDARQELEEGDEDHQKLAIIKKDANDDTKWDRIADYKDFKEYATDSAAFSNVTSPIWDMCTYDGYVYASLPNSRGIVMFKGHPAEGNEQPNEYGWYWEEVIGKYNGVNNLGLAEDAEGYSGDEAGLITMAATPFTFNNQLYLMNFDNTISAELSAVTGIVSALVQDDVKASDYLKPMYTTLNYPQKLWKYNDNTGKFEEVEGFTKYMKDNCIEYVWRAETYNDKLYITTMDSAVLYNYVTNLKGSNFTDLTEEEIDSLIKKIDEFINMIGGLGSGDEKLTQIKTLLENLKTMLQEYVEVANDNEKFYEYVIKYESVIKQIEDLGSSSDSILNMAGQEFQDLYNRVDWTGLKMYSYIAKTIKNDVWGFDLLRTSDGENFEIITDSGFNDKYNYGGRSLVATDNGLYIGTANPFFGAQLWRLTDGTENPGEDPENPGEDPENPGEDPDNPGEDPDNPGEDPENPGEDPENPGEDPENPGEDPDNPGEDPDNPGEDPEKPDDSNKDDAEDDFKDSVKDPDKLTDGLNNVNNSYNYSNNANKPDSTTSPNKLPNAGRKYIVIIGGIAVAELLFVGFKYFRYKYIDKF